MTAEDQEYTYPAYSSALPMNAHAPNIGNAPRKSISLDFSN